MRSRCVDARTANTPDRSGERGEAGPAKGQGLYHTAGSNAPAAATALARCNGAAERLFLLLEPGGDISQHGEPPLVRVGARARPASHCSLSDLGRRVESVRAADATTGTRTHARPTRRFTRSLATHDAHSPPQGTTQAGGRERTPSRPPHRRLARRCSSVRASASSCSTRTPPPCGGNLWLVTLSALRHQRARRQCARRSLNHISRARRSPIRASTCAQRRAPPSPRASAGSSSGALHSVWRKAVGRSTALIRELVASEIRPRCRATFRQRSADMRHRRLTPPPRRFLPWTSTRAVSAGRIFQCCRSPRVRSPRARITRCHFYAWTPSARCWIHTRARARQH